MNLNLSDFMRVIRRLVIQGFNSRFICDLLFS